MVTLLLLSSSAWAQFAVETAGNAGRAPRQSAVGEAAILDRTVLDPAVRAARRAVQLPAIDRDALLAEDAQVDGAPGIPMRIGINRPIEETASTQTHGQWQTLADGSSLWSFQLESPGAEAIRVHFGNLILPPGSHLVIAGTHGRIESIKATGASPDVWSAPVGGEVAFIEFQRPVNADPAEPVIVIDQISHLYRGIGGAGKGLMDDPIGEVAAEQGLLSCHEDVNCWPVDESARDAVGRMIFTIAGEGTFVCTGALVNDDDPNTFAGYFLTANHCIDSQAAADTLVVYWFYQSSTCDGSVPSVLTRPRSSGATLLAESSTFGGTDSSFLRFHDDPTDGQGFAAWTTSSPSNGSSVHGIHHPGGTYKRYSSGPVTQSSPICSSLPLSRFVYNDWNLGITEGGSSGSPLFDDQWRLVGQLYGACYFTGTSPGCNNPQSYNNVYGRFSSFFPSISSYLNTITPDDPYEPNDGLGQAAAVGIGSHGLRLVDFDDYFAIVADAPGELTANATFSTSSMDLNLFLLSETGDVLASSAGSGPAEQLSLAVGAGTYVLHANRIGGWGGDYTLEIQLTVEGCQPEPLLPESAGVPKNRYLSFVPANAGQVSAIRVTFEQAHVPDPANNPAYPAPDLGELNGRSMWVGEPFGFISRDLPLTMAYAAALQCEPYYTDWAAYDTVNVFAPQIVPSSAYSVQAVYEACDLENPTSYSAPLVVTTARWGDIAEPLQLASPNALTQPTVLDIALMVDTLKDMPTGSDRTRAQLQPASIDPSSDVSVVDISFVVDAVKGFAYPFSAGFPCP